MLTEIWCRVFADGKEVDIEQKLAIIRPLVSLSGEDDIRIFNHLAKKYNQLPI